MTNITVDSHQDADEILSAVTELVKNSPLVNEVQTCRDCTQPLRLFDGDTVVVAYTSTGGWQSNISVIKRRAVTCEKHAPNPREAMWRLDGSAAIATVTMTNDTLEVKSLEAEAKGGL